LANMIYIPGKCLLNYLSQSLVSYLYIVPANPRLKTNAFEKVLNT